MFFKTSRTLLATSVVLAFSMVIFLNSHRTIAQIKIETIDKEQSKVKLIGWPQQNLNYKKGRDLEGLYNFVINSKSVSKSTFMTYKKLEVGYYWNHCEIPIRKEWLLRKRYHGYEFLPGQDLKNKCLGQYFRLVKFKYGEKICSYIWYNETDYSTEQGWDGQASKQFPDLTMVTCGNRQNFQRKHFKTGGDDDDIITTITITYPDAK